MFINLTEINYILNIRSFIAFLPGFSVNFNAKNPLT
jgi:hypothetical protein